MEKQVSIEDSDMRKLSGSLPVFPTGTDHWRGGWVWSMSTSRGFRHAKVVRLITK